MIPETHYAQSSGAEIAYRVVGEGPRDILFTLAFASHLDLLWEAYREVREAGWELVNADCVLVGEEPRIADVRDEMRDRLAAALGVEPGLVSVRATTTDGLGYTGRGEGLAAQAVALLRR